MDDSVADQLGLPALVCEPKARGTPALRGWYGALDNLFCVLKRDGATAIEMRPPDRDYPDKAFFQDFVALPYGARRTRIDRIRGPIGPVATSPGVIAELLMRRPPTNPCR
jgi:hypothetical protein